MVGTSALSRRTAGSSRANLALAVADVNWYTTENLFREVNRPDVSALLLKCVDYQVAWRRGHRPWTWGRQLSEDRERLWLRDFVLPSGWMKRFPRYGMRPIGRAIADWQARHVPQSRLALVMTYPHYLYLRDQVRPDSCIYYNIDDYTHYWPRFADRVNDLERQMVRESDLTVCVSRLRCEELRVAVPGAAHRVHHLPHGAPAGVIVDQPQDRPAPAPADIAHLPGPLLGYVGTLEDRVDWRLLGRLADAFPEASIVLIGRLNRSRTGSWTQLRRDCLARRNVHHIGWRDQTALGAYNRGFDVCLIPYLTEHPFNLVCCPTKIMDYMGSSRPVVSTSLPECQLYAELFRIAPDEAGFFDAVRAILRDGSDDGLATRRLAWANDHSCARVAERFLDWLP